MIRIALHIFQALFLLGSLGIVASYSKFRQVELVLAAAIYATAAVLSLVTGAWWPLGVGFGLAWVLLLVVGDRSQPGHRSFDLAQFLTRVDREGKSGAATLERALADASSDKAVLAVLASHGMSTDELHSIHSELGRFGLPQYADVVVRTPSLLNEYFKLRSGPLPAGWTETDRTLRIATLLRERLGG